ncbi:adhesion G-protein coupled receptor G5 isoform X4 [Leptonychotes weddellii]|uniref:Adhesion G-protein coupled receptor G5 isoform X4 n=1 Tax=Leptonychotes weddellii TaxID=9713 RepID=A0A7F8Q773_LEPWE|nr:adhesion G-protein coupled receptor G5 isoform X4 [Leptonychotes weddellii]
MDCWGAFFLCLCFMTSQSETMETSQEPLLWMEKLEVMSTSRNSTSLADQQRKARKGFPKEVSTKLHQKESLIRGLEYRLLNASFGGSNLTLQTPTIQSLIFKLGCNFAGLSLSSTTLERVPQVSHAMQFPAELTQDACRTPPRELRLICVYFFTDYFFQNINSSLLNNYVLGAQLGHGHVSNLSEPINISFWHNQSLEGYTVTCVFWKEGASEHYWGLWSPEGCRTEKPSPSQVLCRCNHLSYFAVLMQLSLAPVPVELLAPLTYISLVGCSISIVASLLTTLLHCQASCLTWMAIEGFNLYLLLGRVYNIYIRRYLLKLCAVGWGVPALLVLFLLVVKSSVYGPHTIPLSDSQGNGTGFRNMSICWVRNPWVHNILVMGYGGLTSLFNLVVLVWALRVLHRLRARDKVLNTRACRDSFTVLGLTVLLGTTWTLAFFSFGVFLLPQLFLFTTFNSLYGFFLFLWFCSHRCRSEAEVEAEMEAFSSSQTMQ